MGIGLVKLTKLKPFSDFLGSLEAFAFGELTSDAGAGQKETHCNSERILQELWTPDAERAIFSYGRSYLRMRRKKQKGPT